MLHVVSDRIKSEGYPVHTCDRSLQSDRSSLSEASQKEPMPAAASGPVGFTC